MVLSMIILSALVGLLMATPVSQYIVWTYFSRETIGKQILYIVILNIVIGMVISDIFFRAFADTMIALLEAYWYAR